jgi:hypothetical protein
MTHKIKRLPWGRSNVFQFPIRNHLMQMFGQRIVIKVVDYGAQES